MPTAGMPWVKLYTEMLNDPKVAQLSDALKWRFVSLVLLAGECDAEGYLVNGDNPLTTPDIAWRLRIDVAALTADLEQLQKKGLLLLEDGFWLVVKFRERQGRSQSEKRQRWRDRQREKRARDRDTTSEEPDVTDDTSMQEPGVTDDSSMTHGSVTVREKRREEKRERERREDNAADAAPASRSPPPPPEKPPEPSRSRLSEGQRRFLALFGAKRFKTVAARDAVLEMEQHYGTDKLLEAGRWAAEKQMSVGRAIGAIRTALPTWGAKKPPPGAAEPAGFAGIREWLARQEEDTHAQDAPHGG